MYWNPNPSHFSEQTIELLNELRSYRQSNDAMRSRIRDDMGMGDKDLEALRLVIHAENQGRTLRQRELASGLKITDASVSALVDRLTRSGHLSREPHPQDRRSVAIKPTRKTKVEVESTLREMHQRMMTATEKLSPQEKATVIRFLKDLNHSTDKA